MIENDLINSITKYENNVRFQQHKIVFEYIYGKQQCNTFQKGL